jgi:hypothetical protein
MAYRLQDARVDILGLFTGREVHGGTTQGVPAQGCVVLQAVAGTVLVHGQIADVSDMHHTSCTSRPLRMRVAPCMSSAMGFYEFRKHGSTHEWGSPDRMASVIS